MNVNEIKAAAERWGSKRKADLYPAEETMYELPRQRVLDMERLADWAVDRMAADEAERIEREKPIDEAWLRSMGWQEWKLRPGESDDEREYDLYMRVGKDMGLWDRRLAWKPHAIWVVRMCDPDINDGLTSEAVEVIGKYGSTVRPTRGNLFDLLAALNPKGE